MYPERDGIAEAVIGLAAAHDPDQLGVLLESLSNVQLRSLAASLATRIAHEQQPAQDISAPEHVCGVAIEAAAKTFGTTPEAVLSAARAQEVCDARAVAMSAARANGLSLPKIAVQFGKDHGSVIHAINRAADRPRLAAAAATIAEDITGRYRQVTAERPPLRLVREQETAPQQATPADLTLVGAAIHAAARTFGTNPNALRGTDRTRTVADARAVAMTAARLSGLSLPKIAAEFGGRDHTVVLHAIRRIQKTPPLREIAERIAKELPAAESPGEDRRARRTTPSEQVAEQVGTTPARGEHADRQAVALAAAVQPNLGPRR
jgi:chromosomal replication initiation ATPase DnaA